MTFGKLFRDKPGDEKIAQAPNPAIVRQKASAVHR
jgi:hypothetical protein